MNMNANIYFLPRAEEDIWCDMICVPFCDWLAEHFVYFEFRTTVLYTISRDSGFLPDYELWLKFMCMCMCM